VIGGLGVGPAGGTGAGPVADGAEPELLLDEIELPLPAGSLEGEPLAGRPGAGLWDAAAVLGLRGAETALGLPAAEPGRGPGTAPPALGGLPGEAPKRLLTAHARPPERGATAAAAGDDDGRAPEESVIPGSVRSGGLVTRAVWALFFTRRSPGPRTIKNAPAGTAAATRIATARTSGARPSGGAWVASPGVVAVGFSPDGRARCRSRCCSSMRTESIPATRFDVSNGSAAPGCH
jgi:hypothetical protein